jgi:sporulation protein YlmC with PRC-barrel domain
MTRPKAIDLALGVLDHQILDVDGRRCGKVDDLELDVEPGGPARVTALLVGPRYWRGRLRGPLGRLLARVGGDAGVKVPWDDVARVASAVELGKTAQELGLGRGDERLGPLIGRLPWA